MAEGGMTGRPSSGAARWIVLTPSVDDAAWKNEIARAAGAAGLECVIFAAGSTPPLDDPSVIVVCDDADLALLHGAHQIAAIVPEPETAPEAVSQIHGIPAPESVWHASLLLARAFALAPDHSVVTAAVLARKPTLLRLFGALEITPPRSGAEVSRTPAVASAFAVYRDLDLPLHSPVPWSERLFVYDTRAARDWTGWGVLDTTGRPRILAQGPFLSLPPGTWRACIRLGVDADAARRQYRVDWGTQTECESEHIRPAKAGVYELELDFTWERTVPAEIRLILLEGSFSGSLVFHGATIRRLVDEAVDEREARKAAV